MQGSVNHIQSEILLELLYKGQARFALLNTEKYPSDQFSYHLRQLVKEKYIEKSADNVYKLSSKGINSATMISPETRKPLEQGFLAIRTVLCREVNGIEQYLVQRRKKVPFMGYLSTPGGKIMYADKVLEAAARVLRFETGLTAQLEVKGIIHMTDTLQGEIAQDKYFFVVRGDGTKGELIENGDTGDNIWMSYEQVLSDEFRHGGLLEVIDTARGMHSWFGEYSF